jgi:hypothetical protein
VHAVARLALDDTDWQATTRAQLAAAALDELKNR